MKAPACVSRSGSSNAVRGIGSSSDSGGSVGARRSYLGMFNDQA